MAKKKWRKLSKLRAGALFVDKGGNLCVKTLNGSNIYLDDGRDNVYYMDPKVRELDIEHLLVNSDDEDLLFLMENKPGKCVCPDCQRKAYLDEQLRG